MISSEETKRPVIVLGAGGHARVLLDALRRSGYGILGLVTSDERLAGSSIKGHPVLGGDDVIRRYSSADILLVNGIGSIPDMEKRVGIFAAFKSQGYRFATVIHPTAILAEDVTMGEGTQIIAGVVIQTACRLGVNVIVNTGAVIDHDCLLEDHVHIAPGVVLSGGVIVGAKTFVGTAASAIQGRHIGASVFVAAGATVVDDIPPGVRVMGTPAKVV